MKQFEIELDENVENEEETKETVYGVFDENMKFSNCLDLSNVNQVEELAVTIANSIKHSNSYNVNYYNGNAVIVDPVNRTVSHRATAGSELITWNLSEVSVFRIIPEIIDLIILNDTVHFNRRLINDSISDICDENEADDITLRFEEATFVYLGLHYGKISVVTPEMPHLDRPVKGRYDGDAVEAIVHVLNSTNDTIRYFDKLTEHVDEIIKTRNDIVPGSDRSALCKIGQYDDKESQDITNDLYYSKSSLKFYTVKRNISDDVTISSKEYKDGDGSLVYTLAFDLIK